MFCWACPIINHVCLISNIWERISNRAEYRDIIIRTILPSLCFTRFTSICNLLCYLWGIIFYVILSFKKMKIFLFIKKIPKKVCLVLEKKCVKKTIILVMRSYCQQPQRPSMLPFEEAKKAVNRWDCNEEALCNQGFNKVDRLRTDPIRQPLMRLPASSVRLHSISAVKYLHLISFG